MGSLRCAPDAELVALWLRFFGTGFEPGCGEVRIVLSVGNICWLAKDEGQRYRGEEVDSRVRVTYCSFTASFASLGMMKQILMRGCGLMFSTV